MSLYDDAAVALIAEGAAGKDEVLYNIKPEEKLKPTELLENGNFVGSTGWFIPAGDTSFVSVSDGKAVFTNAVADEFRRIRTEDDAEGRVFEAGKKYKISFTVTDFERSADDVNLRAAEVDNKLIILVSGNGNFSAIYTAQADERFQFKVAGGAGVTSTLSCKISNVSIKEVEQAPLDFTFTRGSNLTATRVAPSGYIEKGRENIFTHSNAFDDSDWSKTTSTVTSGQSGYDGSTGAWDLAKTTEFGGLEQTVSSDNVQTFSVYAKADSVDYVRLWVTGSKYAIYYLSGDGSVTAESGNIDAQIEKIGTAGWYRCSLTVDASVTLVKINPAANASPADLGATGSIHVQNAQLEAGLVATDYIDSGSSTGEAGILEDSPRFDYLDVTCPHLLMEPTRVNYFAHSEYLAGTFGTINSTFTANADKSPEGVNNATSVLESTADAAHGLQKIDIDIEDGVFYSYSFFVKAKGRTKFLVQHSEATTMNTSVTVDLSGTPSVTEGRAAATGSQNIVDYGDGWYRVEINGREGLADDADSNFNIFFHNGSGTSYVGDTTKGFLFYGFQIEKKHFCTSYIPNHGTSAGVTRNEDDTNTIDLSDYMDGEDVTLFVDLADNPLLIRDGSTSGIKLSNGTSDASSIRFYRSYENVANGGLRTMVYFANNENDGEDINVHQITESGRVKVAVRRVKSTGEFTVFYDGAQKSQDFSGRFDNFDSLKIDGRNQPLFINSVIVFDRALTDDECTSLTTV